MKTKINLPVVRVLAVCALALSGCNSITDTGSDPYTPVPQEREVLKGVINGLGGGRGITLQYNNNADDAGSFLGAQPSHPTDGPEPIPFSFGSLVVGTEYDIRVTGQPFGKNCVPVSGATGRLVKGEPTNVVIECTSTRPRYDLTVRIPTTSSVFRGLPGATVVLTTGEQMFAKPATDAVLAAAGTHYELKFEDALFNAAGQPAPFLWSVNASFTDPEGKEGRCQVAGGANPTNPTTGVPAGDPRGTPGGPQQPTADVDITVVGLSQAQTTSACQFTISGSVAYSAPPGGVAETGAFPGCTGTQTEMQADPDCLLLELRDVQAKVKASYAVGQYTTGFTFSDAVSGNPLQFSSTIDAIYDVAVKNHPTGRICVVGDAGAVSLYRTGTFNPVDITPLAAATTIGTPAVAARAWGTRLNVFCRVRPAANQTLKGTYRPTRWFRTSAPPAGGGPAATATVTYDNYDTTKHNSGSNDMLTFFDDGTFLFGTHAQLVQALAETGVSAGAYSPQVEHGFYDYNDPDNDPATANGTLRFTLITDTNPAGQFPTTFGSVATPLTSAASRNGSGGLSAMPGPVVTATPTAGAGIGVWNAVMTNVGKTTYTFGFGTNPGQTLSRMTGRFGTAPIGTLDWELSEPQSLNNEFTGAWISQDHRRFWVWDYLTNYGNHVGVLGGAPSLNAACFTILNAHAAAGIYTRRGSSSGCYPLDRSTPGSGFGANFIQSIDFHLTNVTVSSNVFMGVAGLNSFNATANTYANVAGSRLVPQFGTSAAAVLPNWIGRIPGGNVAADGRSPSPTLYLVAPAGGFAAKVANTYLSEIGQPASLYFDDAATIAALASWCDSDVLGIRTTLNGAPINYPVYLCRNRP